MTWILRLFPQFVATVTRADAAELAVSRLHQEVGYLKAKAEDAEANRQKWEAIADRLSLRYQGFRLTGNASEAAPAPPPVPQDRMQMPQRMMARDAQRAQTAEFWKQMQAQVAANDANPTN